MTISVSDNTPRVSYSVAQGQTQTSFTVNFEFFAAADLNVFVDNTLKTITTHYTVSGGNGSTGTVTMSVTGASGGSTVVITRDIALERTTDFPVSGAFNISSLNTELDKLVAIDADVDDTISRSIRLQDSDASASMELPLKAARVGTVLGFNATTGAAEAGPSITAVQSLADVTTSINLLGTSAVVEDMGLLATSAVIEDMGLLATSSNISAMALLGTSAVVTDMGLLGTSAVVEDMGFLGTSSNVTAMANLGTSTVVGHMAALNASGVISNISTVATDISNVNSVATNLSSVNDFAARYRVASSEPSSSLDVGDLLFDTTANQLKVYKSGGWEAASAFGNLSSDSTPELGGNLDVVTHSIVSSSDRNIAITPNGAGVVRIDGNVDISTGAIDLKNGGTQSYIRFYCESSNAHYAQLQAPAHSAFGGNITLTMPATTGTLALTSQLPTSGISSGNVATFTSGVADDDFLRVSGTSIEGRSASELLSDIGATTEATAEANSVALAIALG
jgi:carbonic anhydrase/acetyltransferase-like protein (isoleucine patch superfamily)|tara:strand:+ start:922 stop:2445 length:1524 start_codon:yes stop_codon:yes gene_type:complete